MSTKRRFQLSASADQQPLRALDAPLQPLQVVSPYLTAAEVIPYLKLGSESALYRLIREHRLPSCRRGRLYLFDIREIDAWVHGHESAIEWARAQRRSA